jgi:hypothetical protein
MKRTTTKEEDLQGPRGSDGLELDDTENEMRCDAMR